MSLFEVGDNVKYQLLGVEEHGKVELVVYTPVGVFCNIKPLMPREGALESNVQLPTYLLTKL